MTSLTTRRSALAVLPLLIAATAAAQTRPVQGAEGWTPERVRAFVVKTYPTVLAGDTAIGHVHILLDAAGQFVRSTSGKSDSVRVWLAGGGGGPSTGRIDGFRINKDGSIDPISTPPVKSSYGLDDIDPTLLQAVSLYGFKAGEVGPRKFVATVLVLKSPHAADWP